MARGADGGGDGGRTEDQPAEASRGGAGGEGGEGGHVHRQVSNEEEFYVDLKFKLNRRLEALDL